MSPQFRSQRLSEAAELSNDDETLPAYQALQFQKGIGASQLELILLGKPLYLVFRQGHLRKVNIAELLLPDLTYFTLANYGIGVKNEIL